MDIMNSIVVSGKIIIKKEEAIKHEKWGWIRRGILVCRMAIHSRLRKPRLVEDSSGYHRLAVLSRGRRTGILNENIIAENYCPRLSDLIR